MHHLDIGEMAEQHAMRMQRALGISGRARGIDDDGGIVARGVDHGEVVGRLLDLAPERFCAAACVADHIDILQVRQPIANFRQLLKTAFVGDDGLGAGVLKAELQRVLAEQREQRHRDETGTERGQMRDRQFQRLRQEHRDAIAAHQSVGLQHIGEAAAVAAQLVERRPLRRAVLVDIDQCEAAGTVGIAVAAGLRDVEPRRDVPAEIAIEFFVESVSVSMIANSLLHLSRSYVASRKRLALKSERVRGYVTSTVIVENPLTRSLRFATASTSPRTRGEVQELSAAFTMPLALAKSIWPAYFARSTPITLPMSFMPAAPVSVTAAEIAAFTSSSDICFGR